MTTECKIRVVWMQDEMETADFHLSRVMPTHSWRRIWLLLALCFAVLYWWSPKPALAQANCNTVACVTAGPRLASLDTQQAVLLDGLLGNLLGVDLNLTVADANGLAQGEIVLGDLLETLRAELNLATPTDVLTANVTIPQLLAALPQVSNNAATVTALNNLAATANLSTAPIRLGDLLQSPDGILSNVTLNVLDLLTGSIQLFNAQNVITTPAPVTISGSALGLAGILNSITLRAQVVEPPVYLCGKDGAQFYSAAMRVSLGLDLVDLTLDTSALESSLQTALGGLITVDVSASIGQLDLYVVVARGVGVISQINAISQAVTIQATPGVVDLYLGAITDTRFFSRTHPIAPATDLDPAIIGSIAVTLTTLNVPTMVMANLEAESFANGANPTATTLNFNAPYPQTQTATTGASFITDLVNSITTNLQLQLSGSLGAAVDLVINSTTLRPLVTATLTTPLTTILNNLVDPLLADLGIGLGDMNITVNGVGQLCDTDNDGNLDPVDSDDDGDGIHDVTEGNGVTNSDNDATPDSLDTDSDNDGIGDATEGHDANHDGQPDRTPAGTDTDNDGLDNAFDPDNGGVPAPLPNTDGDALPDFQDPDDDGDGMKTINEDANNNGNPADDDSDGDGRPNYLDPANTNPCLPNANAPACTDDTDNDGTPDDSDPAPTDPCIPNPNALACPTGDTDNDGTPNGSDPAPTNPCIPNANATACQNDTDGDGTPNPNDPAPTDPCVPNANAVACPTGDADNDGTPNSSDPAPLNPCIPNPNAVACATGDADDDATPNGSDPAPTNPCVPNANAATCPTGDTDNDGTPNNTDPAPTDPCIPNPNAAACDRGTGAGLIIYIPLAFQQPLFFGPSTP